MPNINPNPSLARKTTPANFPVLFLYQNDGFYYYAAHCCDFKDPHTAVLVSPFPLDEVVCSPGMGSGGLENPGDPIIVDKHPTITDIITKFAEFNAPLGTGRIHRIDDHFETVLRRREFFVHASDKVTVTDLIDYRKFSIDTTGGNRPSRLLEPVTVDSKIYHKVYSMKFVQVSHKFLLCNCGAVADPAPCAQLIELNQKCLIAESCRFQQVKGDHKIEAEEILGTDQMSQRQNNLFVLRLPSPIMGLNKVFVLTKNLN